MTVVNDEIRAELVSRGIWQDFVRRRADIREGETARSAARKVLEEMAPDLAPLLKVPGRPRKASAASAKSEASVSAPTLQKAVSARPAPFVAPAVSKEAFANRRCSLATAFLWAYSNLCFADVVPDDAPSAVAWQMFCDMKASPAMKSDLLKAGIGSAMRRSETEDDGGQAFDGAGEYDLLKALAEGGAS